MRRWETSNIICDSFHITLTFDRKDPSLCDVSWFVAGGGSRESSHHLLP